MIVEPGKSLSEWKGIRVYLEVKEIARSGPVLEELKIRSQKFQGRKARR